MKKQFKLPYVSFCDRSDEFKPMKQKYEYTYANYTVGQKRFVTKIFNDIDSCSRIIDKDLAKQSLAMIILETSIVPELGSNFNDKEFEQAFEAFWSEPIGFSQIQRKDHKNYILYIHFIFLLSILFFNVIIIKNSVGVFLYLPFKSICLIATTLLLLSEIIVIVRYLLKNNN